MATNSPPARGRADLEELKSKFQNGMLSKATFLQFAGVWLTLSILVLIAVFVGAIFGYLIGSTPTIGSFGNPVTENTMSLYQKASDLIFQRANSLLNTVLINVLLPILTLVLGYTFAQIKQGSTPE